MAYLLLYFKKWENDSTSACSKWFFVLFCFVSHYPMSKECDLGLNSKWAQKQLLGSFSVPKTLIWNTLVYCAENNHPHESVKSRSDLTKMTSSGESLTSPTILPLPRCVSANADYSFLNCCFSWKSVSASRDVLKMLCPGSEPTPHLEFGIWHTIMRQILYSYVCVWMYMCKYIYIILLHTYIHICVYTYIHNL